MELNEIRELFDKGELFKAIEEIDSIVDLKNQPFTYIIDYHILYYDIFLRMGKYEQCVSIAEDLITVSNFKRDIDIMIDFKIMKAEALWRWNKLNELVIIVNEAEQNLFELKDVEAEKNMERYSQLKLLKGIHYRFMGERDLALEYFNESFMIAEKIGKTELLSSCYTALGLIHLDKGILNVAGDYLRQSEIMCLELADMDGYSLTLHHIGKLHESLGEVNKALESYNRSLEIASRYEYARTVAFSTSALGLLYAKLNDPKMALEYLNTSLIHFQSLDNVHFVAKTLFDIIVVMVSNNLEDVQDYVDQISDVNRKYNDNLLIGLYYKLSIATINKIGDRMSERAMALETFHEIANDEIYDYNLFVYSVLNLTEMLLQELRFTNNLEVIDDLLEVTELLRIKQHSTQSSLLLVESYILEAKLAQLELNFNKAYEILNKAFEVARDKNLKEMMQKVSKEYDLLLDDFRFDAKEPVKLQSIMQRIENSEFDEYIAGLMKARVDSEEASQEHPVLCLLIREPGEIIYRLYLNEDLVVSEDYITSMLNTIEMFMGEMMIYDGKLERLKHGEYHILLRMISNYKLIYCYESETSYSGLERFEKLISRLTPLLENHQEHSIEELKQITLSLF